ncbi:2-succinylbenzoate--CoA ligase [Mastigocladopsis repens]|uniref:2-succinylbenzoate--CoA ligase n=1 Tax=Mastigocladopsis repens TaxID=221287 RepID=UPI0003125A34|nr:2-succinylbenzoate--CoA ligase [Mastigocladopsis repens]
MEKTLENFVKLGFYQSLPNDWLICDDSHLFTQLTKQLYLELTQFSYYRGTPLRIILAEREPVRFLAGFIAACAARCPVFLCNPDWRKQEWQQVFDLVKPDLIWGLGTKNWGVGGVEEVGGEKASLYSPTFPSLHSALIMIPTGGSSGKMKFAIHTWETLMASARGFTEHFLRNQINSFCVLPLYHVSGLMQFLRSFTTGGKLVIQPFKELEAGQIDNIETSDFFISLVPTQLQRLLQNPKLTEWLSRFQTVLLGGAPAWDELLEKARYYNIRLAPTYGMTETASQIATLKPDDFLNGKDSCTQILPHAHIKICNEQGEELNSNQIGNITIYSQSLALGYYPKIWENQEYLQVDDLGFLDTQGYLHIVGRNSDKIITGGENVYPIEIESTIRATEMVADVCVIGIADKLWGQAVTAIYIPKNPNTSALKIKTLLKEKLCKFKIPKYWIPLQNLPRNSQGKINRQQLEKIATKFLQTSGLSH